MNREEYFRADWARLAYNRTRFRMPFNHTTAFNTGDIVPLEVEQIYPGDGLSSKFSYLIRSFTPLNPIMSNIYFDVYSFFVPMRLVWEHWENFYGQNDTSAWTQTYQYQIPQCQAPDGDDSGDSYHMIGEYLGLVTDLDSSYKVSDLWRRAYLNIYNDWFRDENLIAPILYSKGDTQEANPVYTYANAPLKAAKFHDYFTSLLPEPTKGEPPVVGPDLKITGKPGSFYDLNNEDIRIHDENGNNIIGDLYHDDGLYINAGESENAMPFSSWNLYAKAAITIEDIRNAAVVTHVLERLASSGSRYVEALQGLWGVTSGDARLQIPEYLGGQRFVINVNDVVSTADTVNAAGDAGQPIGKVGALIKQGNGCHLFNKAFTEHGMLFTVGVIRIEQSYFQGIDRKFTDKDFFDFYMPALANLGNQPVFMEQINLNWNNENGGAHGSTDLESTFRKHVFGYSEAWAHLRYTPYRLSSIMRPNAVLSLSSWTAADILSAASTFGLNQAFIEQGPTGLDRCLAVPSATRGSLQWFGDFHFENTWTRILPAHSRPGLTRI